MDLILRFNTLFSFFTFQFLKMLHEKLDKFIGMVPIVGELTDIDNSKV